MADKNTLLALVDTNIPDNTSGEISPGDLRDVDQQIISASANLDELTEQEFLGKVKFSGGIEGDSPDNEMTVNEFSDFPEPMLPNMNYRIGANVVLPDILPTSWGDLPDNIEFSGSIASSRITYNGTGDLFTANDIGFFKVSTLRIDAPNARIYNITQTSVPTTINLITASIVSCDSFGHFDVFGVLIKTISAGSVNNGITIGDNVLVFSVSEIAITSTNAGFIFADLQTSLLSTLELTDVRVAGPVGSSMLSGLAGSANIAANQRAKIASCEMLTDSVALSGGLTEDDIRYRFDTVTGVRDTNPDSLITLSNNSTNTVITASSTDGSNAVLIAGTWVEKDSSQYATTSAGKISALFEYEIPAPITAAITLEPVSGTNVVIAAYIVIDGVVQTESAAVMRTDNNDPKQLTVIWQEPQSNSQNTDVEVYVENRSGTTNILVSNAVLRVR